MTVQVVGCDDNEPRQVDCNHHEWNLDEHWDTRQLRDIKKVVNKLISKVEVV